MSKFEDIHIEWRSEISGTCGKYSAIARNLLTPLIEGGAKIKISVDESYLPDHLKIESEEWSKIITESQAIAEAPIKIDQCIPSRFQPVEDKINIGYITWETTRLPNEWSSHIDRTCYHLFTTSESVTEVAKESGVSIPVSTLRPCIDPTYWSPEGEVTNINGVNKEDVKFLYVANFIPRKNLEDLVLSFCVAFAGVKDAVLIIKTYGQQNNAAQKKAIRQAIGTMKGRVNGIPDLPRIVVLDELVSEEQLKRVIRGCDVYVCSSKGEGASLPVLQAMSMEKLVIANQFMSHGDFLSDKNSVVVDYSLTPCVNSSNSVYTSNQMWACPNIEDFINKFRLCYSSIKSETHKNIMAEGRNTIKEKFSPEKNAEIFAEKIRELRSNATEQKGSTKDFINQLAH